MSLSKLLGVVLAFATLVHADDKPLKIAVIPKGTTHVFWKSVEAGAKNAGLLAAAILALTDRKLAALLKAWRKHQTASVGENPTK